MVAKTRGAAGAVAELNAATTRIQDLGKIPNALAVSEMVRLHPAEFTELFRRLEGAWDSPERIVLALNSVVEEEFAGNGSAAETVKT